jgi:hypothetical protein
VRGACLAVGRLFTYEIADDTLKQLLRIDDELMQLCKWLNEKRDVEVSSKLIPIVDDLTHILVEAGKNKLHSVQRQDLFGRKTYVELTDLFDRASKVLL